MFTTIVFLLLINEFIHNGCDMLQKNERKQELFCYLFAEIIYDYDSDLGIAQGQGYHNTLNALSSTTPIKLRSKVLDFHCLVLFNHCRMVRDWLLRSRSFTMEEYPYLMQDCIFLVQDKILHF